MPSILLKDVSPSLHKRLKKRAEQNRRSMAQEAVFILEGSLRDLPPLQLPPLIKPRRPLTTEAILRAIRSGRK